MSRRLIINYACCHAVISACYTGYVLPCRYTWDNKSVLYRIVAIHIIVYTNTKCDIKHSGYSSVTRCVLTQAQYPCIWHFFVQKNKWTKVINCRGFEPGLLIWYSIAFTTKPPVLLIEFYGFAHLNTSLLISYCNHSLHLYI